MKNIPAKKIRSGNAVTIIRGQNNPQGNLADKAAWADLQHAVICAGRNKGRDRGAVM
jgi:hypothetical protein